MQCIDFDGYFLSVVIRLVGQANMLNYNRAHDCYVTKTKTIWPTYPLTHTFLSCATFFQNR